MTGFLKRIEWTVSLFMVLNPLLAIAGMVWLASQDMLWNPAIFIFAIIYAGAAALGITAGYHRLMSHRSYEAHPMVEWFFLLMGASTFEGSALKWSSDHRRHHGHVDTEHDPYSIMKGFWHAHMGWLFNKDTVDLPLEKVADLQKNSRILFQHRHYVLIALAMGYLIPMAVGAFFGSALAGLIVAGSFRIVLNQQSTFFINSLCHMFGKQTYSKDVSARDSFWVAVLTHGEGYHNFHHTFQIDYRNGIKWYHWDPTKWTIATLKYLGLAAKLRTIPAAEIMRARLQTEGLKLSHHGFSPERIEQMKVKILEAQIRWKKMKDEYALMKQHAREVGEEKLRLLRYEIEMAKAEFRWALKQWRVSMKMELALARR